MPGDKETEFIEILNILKNNPRGMSLKQISAAIGMNRVTVARYLDILRTSGKIDMEPYGQAKVYYLSHRVPVSAMLDYTPGPVVVIGNDKRIIYANSPFQKFFEKSFDEIEGFCLFDVIPEDALSDVLVSGINSPLYDKGMSDEVWIKKDGKDFCFLMKMLPTVFENGYPGLTLLFENITGKKRIEEIVRIQRDLAFKLSAARSYDEALPMALRVGIDILDMDSGIIYLLDERTGEFTNYCSEGLGKEFLSFFDTLDQNSEFFEVISNGGVIYSQDPFTDFLSEKKISTIKNEGLKNFAIVPITDDGAIVGTFHLCSHRISEVRYNERMKGFETMASHVGNTISRIRTQDKLKKSEMRYRLLFNNANDGIIIHGMENDKIPGVIIDVNDKACEKLGYSRDELLKMRISDIDLNLKIEEQAEILKKFSLDREVTFESTHQTKDGHKKPV
ncbi:PAS domain S-box protein [Methanochimaera problematica]|nr:PAS domain S-box protein [Methanoplanus sp. FWC-SCC4]